MSDVTNKKLSKDETYEMLDDFVMVAEDARFPPFSVPTNKKEDRFLLALSEEFDEFLYKRKPYDSFDAVLAAYSDEIVEARAWRSLGYSPEEAAREVLRRSLRDAGRDEKTARRQANREYDRLAKVSQMFAEKIYPWGDLAWL